MLFRKKICCADKPVVMQKAHEGNPEPTKIRFSYVRIFITNVSVTICVCLMLSELMPTII